MLCKKVQSEVKMKTSLSRKRNNRRNARKTSGNVADGLVENGDCRIRKGKRAKGAGLKDDGDDEESQDGMMVGEEKEQYQDMLQLFPPVDLDCCPPEHPVVPGTPVILHGVVLHETPAGLIVLNVRWRKRVFSGALIDIDKNKCSAQKIHPDPGSTCDDAKFIPIKRLRFPSAGDMGPSAKPVDAQPSPESPISYPSSQEKATEKGAKTASKCGKRMVAMSDPPAKLEEDVKKVVKPPEPSYIECLEPNCGKRYKHVNGLKYHRRTAHPPKTEEGSGKESKSETPEELSHSDGENGEDKPDSESSSDVKGTEPKETLKRKCKKRLGKDEDSTWDKDGSGENTEKEELTENEKRIERLRIEAQKASAALQDIIKQEQCLEKRGSETDDNECDVDTRRHDVDESADLKDSHVLSDNREGSVAVAIKQEVFDDDLIPSRSGDCNVDAPYLECSVRGSADSPNTDKTYFLRNSSERVVSELERETVGNSNNLRLPASNYAQYSPTLGNLNPQEITDSMCDALAPAVSCQEECALSAVNRLTEATDVSSGLTVVSSGFPRYAISTTVSSASQGKVLLCAPSLVVQRLVGDNLLADLAMHSVIPVHEKLPTVWSCQPGDEIVPPSDEERSCSGSPDCPLLDCDKIFAVERATDVLKPDAAVYVNSEKAPRSSINPVEASASAGVSENPSLLDDQEKVRPYLASAAAFAPQPQPSAPAGLRMTYRPIAGDVTPSNELQRLLPSGLGFLGETSSSHHFSPQLLSILNPAVGKKYFEPPVGECDAGETKTPSKPAFEKKPSLVAESLGAAVGGEPPVSKVTTFLQPNISAGWPVCRPAASQVCASSVVVSDACVGSIDQELGSLFSRSLEGKVPMERMQILPATKPSLSSFPARSSEPFRDMPRAGTFVTSASSLRINPPGGGGEERVQVGVKTWKPEEVFLTTASLTPESTPLAALPTVSKVLMQNPESVCSTAVEGLPSLQAGAFAANPSTPASLAKAKVTAKRPGQPVTIAPAPGLPLSLAGVVPGMRPSVAELTSGPSTSPVDPDKGQPHVSRFTLTSDNRLVPSPVENRGRPRKVRVEKTQQVPIGTALDIERSRGPAETSVVRKRPASPVARPSVIQPSSQAVSQSKSAALSPPDKMSKADLSVWSEFRRDSTRIPEVQSPEECERANSMPDHRQVIDGRQQQPLQEGFKTFGSSPVNFASSSQVAAPTRLSPSPGRLPSPRGSDISRMQHSLPGPLPSPRMSRASPMNSPFQNMLFSSSRLEDVAPGDKVDASRKDLSERQMKLMMDAASVSSAFEHARSASQRVPMSASHHPFLPHSSPSPGSHFKASLHASDLDRDLRHREQPSFTHFLFPKANGGLRSPVHRASDLQRNPPRAQPEPIPGFSGARFSAPSNSAFHSRHEFARSDRALFERRIGGDDRTDNRQHNVRESRYSSHSSVGHQRNSASAGPSPATHHSTNLVLGRADGAIIRPLNFESSRQIDKS